MLTLLIVQSTSVYDDPSMKSYTVCNTAYMFQNEQDASPETNVNCGISSVNWSYYRVQPEDLKTTSSMTRSSLSRIARLTVNRPFTTCFERVSNPKRWHRRR